LAYQRVRAMSGLPPKAGIADASSKSVSHLEIF
jgi:hypothetical protein